MREFMVLRKTTVQQFFTVKAANAAEARDIIEKETERVWGQGYFSAEWELEEGKIRDRRVIDASEAERWLTEPVYFVRTKEWQERL